MISRVGSASHTFLAEKRSSKICTATGNLTHPVLMRHPMRSDQPHLHVWQKQLHHTAPLNFKDLLNLLQYIGL